MMRRWRSRSRPFRFRTEHEAGSARQAPVPNARDGRCRATVATHRTGEGGVRKPRRVTRTAGILERRDFRATERPGRMFGVTASAVGDESEVRPREPRLVVSERRSPNRSARGSKQRSEPALRTGRPRSTRYASAGTGGRTVREVIERPAVRYLRSGGHPPGLPRTWPSRMGPMALAARIAQSSEY
jgi:hypothetical protein